MRRKLIIAVVCTVLLSGCDANSVTTETPIETITAQETEDEKEEETIKVEEEGLSKTKKLEIIAYINGILDPLNETNMSSAQLEAKADEVWKEAETKFGITESDIWSIMMNVNLVKEYYSNSYVETIIEYQATLEDNGYGTVVIAISKDALNEYIRALGSKEESTLNSMIQNGEVTHEVNGTKVNILDRGLATTKVKLLEGLNEGATVYVISEQVKKK